MVMNLAGFETKDGHFFVFEERGALVVAQIDPSTVRWEELWNSNSLSTNKKQES